MNSLEEINEFVRVGFAMKTLYDVVSEMDLSTVENISKLEDAVNLLEMHEAEVRRLRQSLNLRLRHNVLKSYLEDLGKRACV